MTRSTFSFYPEVREGYRPANRPNTTFSTGERQISEAGTSSVALELTATGPEGEQIKQPGIDLTIYGPGDVTNLDGDQVVRVEPEPDTTSFPPNYFPLVEFDSPQLPWVFSPQRADDQGRNRPWCCLVVVPRSRTEFQPSGPGPLPVLETPAEQLPDPVESWAWAHAQIAGEEGKKDPAETFSSESTETVSRLLCPRNLDSETKYRACVVPTFEPGRRAGLGLEPYPDGRSTVKLAWNDEDAIRLPVYYNWEFTTSKEGDFESLVEELEPVQLDDSVGYRAIDVSNPGPDKLKLPYEEATNTGTVGIGGALKSVDAQPDRYDPQMQTTLRDLLNTPGEIDTQTNYDAVGPPLYGQFHAGVPFLEPETLDSKEYFYPRWFNTLNTDPRHRIAAGYGTAVVRDHQQRFMNSAWDQFGDLDGLNEYLNRMQLSQGVLSMRHEVLESYSPGDLLGVTAPLHGALTDDEGRGNTVRGTITGTDLPGGLASTSFRQLTRPTGPLARQQGRSLDPNVLSLRLETGRVPRVSGLGVTTETPVSDDEAGALAAPGTGPAPARRQDGQSGPTAESGPTEPPSTADEDRPPEIEQLLTAIDGVESHVEAASGAVSEFALAVKQNDAQTIRRHVEQRPTVVDRCEAIGRNTFDPLSRAVAKLLASPRPEELPESFDRETASGHLQELHGARRQLETAIRGAVEALDTAQPAKTARQRLDRAQSALDQLRRESSRLRSAVESSGPALSTPMMADSPVESIESVETDEVSLVTDSKLDLTEPQPVELPDEETLRSSILDELNPRTRLPELAGEITGLGNLFEREDPVGEVLASPTFTETASELLAEFDQESFLPGAGEVPRSSIGLLQTNPEFIEAFMTGLNHEFARELQWRNFPTDRRGTYFRRFWDRRIDPEADKSNPEDMADIPPVHTWDENELGANLLHSDGERVVLLVRGELLRRYPNTTIFAAKAVEGKNSQSDLKEPDRIPALPESPVSRDDDGKEIKFPEFRGRLDPDITFFGFDLSPKQALYDPYHEGNNQPDDHPDEGWFFVFQEPPAETRFGLDEADTAEHRIPAGVESNAGPPRESEDDRDVLGWRDLSWAQLSDGNPDDIRYVSVSDSRPGRENWRVSAGSSQFDAGDAAEWGYNSAHMARVTWQLPVRVSIHADDMIPEYQFRTDGGQR